MNGRFGMALIITAMLPWVGQPVFAQDKPAPIVEAVVGRSGFVDEVWDYFGTIGGGARVFVTPRLAIGPEVTYLSGQFDALEASNLTVTANLTFDIVRGRWHTPGRAVFRRRRRLPATDDAGRRRTGIDGARTLHVE